MLLELKGFNTDRRTGDIYFKVFYFRKFKE